MLILRYSFSDEGRSVLSGKHIGDWPVVYLIHNDDEAYVGETCSFVNRFSQHLSNPNRRNLKEICVILDDEFNKSATLDIEQSLIQLFNADEMFNLQNLNAGQSVKHDYYQRELYTNKLPDIWRELQAMGLAVHDFEELRNSPLFKFSPYISLTAEQNDVCMDVLSDMLEKLVEGSEGTSVIHGSAGTGKTVMAINMMFMLCTASEVSKDPSKVTVGFTDEQMVVHDLFNFIKENGGLRIGLVVPMASLRKTLRFVFSNTKNGLKGSMVMGPNDVVSELINSGFEPFDVLFVDESHRLARRKNITSYRSLDNAREMLGMNPEVSTQLDWIVRCSRYRVLFYDVDQTVKGADITPEQFDEAIGPSREDYILNTQLRCEAGGEYLHYLDRILRCRQAKAENVENYDLCLFDDVNDMVTSIKRLDKSMGLCRNVAGYSWPWKTKGMKSEDIKAQGLFDIEIEGYRYVWNMSNVEWIMRKESVDEIGCIHTTQGYDLNYVGVIFGREIDYDEFENRIVVDLDRFYDSNVKKGTDPDVVRKYILNAYKVMMTRGIKGCYIYVCNPSLRKYLGRFIKSNSARSSSC